MTHTERARERILRLKAFVKTMAVGSAALPEYGILLTLVSEWRPNTEYTPDDIVSRPEIPMVYEVVQTVTSQAHQPPEAQGMLAIYRPIPQRWPDGTITWVFGMTGITGMTVRHNGRRWGYIPQGGTAVVHEPSAALPAVWRDEGAI